VCAWPPRLLLTLSLREWMTEDRLACLGGDVIDQADLTAMDDVYGNKKRGQPPYNPRMMSDPWKIHLKTLEGLSEISSYDAISVKMPPKGSQES
jgi:hypothetical protein